MDEREALLAAVNEKPLDHFLRCVYADWLDEHGEVEEALRQREWVAAYEYLAENFVETYDWEEDQPEDDEPDVGGAPRKPTYKEVISTVNYYRDGLQDDGGICFGSDDGPERMHDPEIRDKFFRAIETVTGVRFDADLPERASFRCAC